VDVVVPRTPPRTASKPTSRHGFCASRASVSFAPPPDARTLTAPPTERSVHLDRGGVGGWYGLGGATTAPLEGVWASGSDVFAVGSGHLLHSRDGGRTFDEATAPIAARAVWGSDRDVFLAAGRSVARSGDGGATWSVYEPFPEDALVQAIAGEGPDLYAVGGSSASVALAAHSADRGATWQTLALPIGGGWLGAVAIRPGDAPGSHAVLVGGYARGAPYEPVLLESHDCGASWTKRALPFKPSGGGHQKIAAICATESALFVATSESIWSVPDAPGSAAAHVDLGGEAKAVACRGEEVFGGGRNGAFVHSADGGRTWTTDELAPLFAAPSFAAPSLTTAAIDVTDDGAVYVVGEGASKAGAGSLIRRAPR
jgi:hypothetical protein